MRRVLALVALVVAFTCSAFAQAVPNRDYKKLISDIALTCPAAFTKGADGRAAFKNAPVSDAFRRQVIPYFASELNKLDGGNWAVLYRMDRQDETPEPGRLTADVVIWKPTRQHFDTMGDRVTSWSLIGPLPNDKDWFVREPSAFPTVCGTLQPPTPPDVPPPPVPVDDSALKLLIAQTATQHREVLAVLASLAQEIQELKQLSGELGAAVLALDERAAALERKKLPCIVGTSRVLGTMRFCPEE
jgi:hypothetical protein